MPSSGSKPGRWRTLFLAAGCVLFVYLLIRLGPGAILALLARLGWSFLLMLAIYAGYNLLRAAALGLCIATGSRPSFLELAAIRAAGEAVQYLTFTGPFLAEPAKALLLKQKGSYTAQAFAATISEYLIYTFTSAAMAAAGLSYLLSNFETSAVVSVAARTVIWISAGFLAAAAVAIAGRIYLIGAILNGMRRLPWVGRLVRIDPVPLRATEDLLFVVLRTRRFFAILALECAAQALLVGELFVFLETLERSFAIEHPFLIESATKFISLGFFFIPAQVGAAEGAYAVVLSELSMPAAAGFGLAVARRLRSLAVSAVGLLVLARRPAQPAGDSR